ncbi:MAG: hypothetical protein QNJ55_11320 [Xenococcus sp. MO_188.B8]|nr:hypothetical protein [Xenococcus sp. MO_188.B8]
MIDKTIKRYPCPSCGAELVFNPEGGKLKCEYCSWEDAIPQSEEELQENSYEQYLNNSRTQLATLSTTAMEISCDNCGAKITFEPPQVAGQCPFCASSIVAQPKQADPTLAPQGIIPFTIGRKEARENLQTWIRQRWFAPNDLKQLAQPEKIQGMYLPFWTYDAFTKSQYRGERGEYYYETETYTEKNEEGKTETKTRQVRHTRWYQVSGWVQRFFDDVLIPATKLVDHKRLEKLEPWRLKDSLRPYEPSYLAGFEAQRSQIELEEGFEKAKAAMVSQIRSDIKRDIGGDEQRIHNVSTSYSAITFKHILLPVWLTSYRYHGEQYQILINANTGEIQGERPYSVAKIVLTVIGVIVAIAVIVAIFNVLS